MSLTQRHYVISNRSQCRPFCTVFRCAAEKIPATCSAREGLSTGEFDLCSTTGIFRWTPPVCPGSSRAYAGLGTCSRSRGFCWSRTGPWWAPVADRETARCHEVLPLGWRRGSRRWGSGTGPARSSAAISTNARRTSNAGQPGTSRRCRQWPSPRLNARNAVVNGHSARAALESKTHRWLKATNAQP